MVYVFKFHPATPTYKEGFSPFYILCEYTISKYPGSMLAIYF